MRRRKNRIEKEEKKTGLRRRKKQDGKGEEKIRNEKKKKKNRIEKEEKKTGMRRRRKTGLRRRRKKTGSRLRRRYYWHLRCCFLIQSYQLNNVHIVHWSYFECLIQHICCVKIIISFCSIAQYST